MNSASSPQRRIAPRALRYVLIGVASLLVVQTGMVAWLKLHENELVFATADSRLDLIEALPADTERIAVPVYPGVALAAVVFRADNARDTGYWILQLHGNADSAFSTSQMRHCQALRRAAGDAPPDCGARAVRRFHLDPRSCRRQVPVAASALCLARQPHTTGAAAG